MAAALIADSVYEKYMYRKQENKVESFMNHGARNTAQQGYALCKRIAHLEREHHNYVHDVDCYELYFGKTESIKDE